MDVIIVSAEISPLRNMPKDRHNDRSCVIHIQRFFFIQSDRGLIIKNTDLLNFIVMSLQLKNIFF